MMTSKLERDNASRRKRMSDPSYRIKVNSTERKRLEDPIKRARKQETNNNYYQNLKINNPDQYEKRLAKTRLNGLKQRRQERINTIKHYGGRCFCCNESEIMFLGMDHINGGGNKHRREIKGKNIYRWLRMNDYPDGFRVACHNCNMAIGFYGKCPHKREDTKKPQVS